MVVVCVVDFSGGWLFGWLVIWGFRCLGCGCLDSGCLGGGCSGRLVGVCLGS